MQEIEEKDQLQLLKDRYDIEGESGDLSQAARNAKVSTPNSSTALKKDKWNQLTSAEKKSMFELTKILNQRKKAEVEMSNAIKQ